MKKIKQILMFCGLVLAVGVGSGGLTRSAQAADTRVANTELQLLGIGMAQELRTDIYLGAIFAPADVKTLDAALADTVPKRMSIKIVAEKWSARELGRTFKERIALNNPRPVWQGQGQYIIAFANTFKDNLQRGDNVTFDHVPGVGTEIAINGGKVNTIRSTSFFNLLLNAWIGDLPPSQAFKAAVTGRGDANQRSTYIAQYDTLLPVPGRTFAVVGDDNKAADKKVAEAKPADVKPAVVAKPVETKPAVAEAKPAESKPVETKPADTKLADTKPVESKPAEPKPAETKPALAEGKPAKVEAKTETVAAIPMLDIPAVEAEIDPDLLFGDYKRDAMKLFRKNQFYPPRAYKDQLKGEGVVRATVDKSGNMLSVEVIESTGERILDRAMVEMVTKSMPLPPLPAELPDDSYNIDIPVRFTL